MRAIKTDDYVSAVLQQANEGLADVLDSDVLVIKSPIRWGLDYAVRLVVENLSPGPKFKGKRAPRLCVLLETTGGYVEIVERIYSIFRRHYDHVDFIVPNFAYSAGTVLVCSGDEIYMDYYSVLGPIDPQYETEPGKFLPGLGYLVKYEQLMTEVNKEKDPQKVRAQLAFLLNRFDPAVLFALEQARDHSIALLEDWLPRHKFKSWTQTKTKKRKVTAAMRKKRARDIAEIIGNPTRWHSHGRGISIRDLESDEINLQIKNFGDDKNLNEKIGNYYHLFTDYCSKLGAGSLGHTVLHTRDGIRRF
jgi:hypothetical protein